MSQLTQQLRAQLQQHAPFTQMDDNAFALLLSHLTLEYFAQGDLVLAPTQQTPERCFVVKQGGVVGLIRDIDSPIDSAIQLDAAIESRINFRATNGECFPLGALLANRPCRLVYYATSDTFLLSFSRAIFDQLVEICPPWRDFATRRLGSLLDQSRRELAANYANTGSAEQSMLTQLGALVKRSPLVCEPTTHLRDVFETMQRERVGSILVTSSNDQAIVGIFTKEDVVGRVVLANIPLDTPVSQVMSSPVLTLTVDALAVDAALLMAQHSIRHIPVMREGQLIGLVSERDLFSLQRLSLRAAGNAIRSASTIEELAQASIDVRELARALVLQGIDAAHITALISRLNDQITQRVIQLTFARTSLNPHGYCWIALGSEGRHEQTIATDQDNALILADEEIPNKEHWLSWAKAVNHALATCGYPLCKGNIMASNAALCLGATQWQERYTSMFSTASPQALLDASIQLDFRSLAGNHVLANGLREFVLNELPKHPLFLKLLASNALKNGPPVAWVGSMVEQLFARAQDQSVDLKLHGTMPFVDAARLFACVFGITETNTAARLKALVAHGFDTIEVDNAIHGFEFLQLLRLRHQIESKTSADQLTNPNLINPNSLSSLDKRILKEAFRQARKLQQRIALDYP